MKNKVLNTTYINYLEINLTKNVKDLYSDNYKTLLRQLEGLNKCRDIQCSWAGRLNSVNMAIFYKIY